MFLQFILQHRFAQADEFFLVFHFLLQEVGLDLVAGVVGLDDLEPVFRRRRILIGAQFHDITCLQRRVQRNQNTIDQSPNGLVSDFRMDTVGKIDRGRPGRQVDDTASWSHAVDIRIEDIVRDVIHVILGIGIRILFKGFEPVEFFDELLLRAGLAFLVGPVGSDTSLSDLIHLFGTDLYFIDPAIRSDDRRMQGLIQVHLRHGDIIFQPARDRPVYGVDVAQDLITVGLGLRNDADRQKVEDLIKTLVFGDHLFIDRI